MAINVSQAFHRTSGNPIDDTLTLTKAQMLATQDALMPSKYLTVCLDDGKLYLYNRENTVDPSTGRFRVFEEGGQPHVIEDSGYHKLTQRPTLHFDADFIAEDDISHNNTVVKFNPEIYSIVSENVELTSTASKAYAAGDLLILDGKLYKATDDIAQGDTIVREGDLTEYVFSESRGVNNYSDAFMFNKQGGVQTTIQYVSGSGVEVLRNANNNADGQAALKNQMYDLSPYDKLKLKYTPYPNTYDNIAVVIKDDLICNWNGITYTNPEDAKRRGWITDFVQSKDQKPSSPQTITLDIASINRDQYIWIFNTGANFAHVMVTDIWMENTKKSPNVEEVTILDECDNQVQKLPTASANLEGVILQYTGDDTAEYTKGFYYECVSDKTDPPTYSWEQKNVQPGGGDEELTPAQVANLISLL